MTVTTGRATSSTAIVLARAGVLTPLSILPQIFTGQTGLLVTFLSNPSVPVVLNQMAALEDNLQKDRKYQPAIYPQDLIT
jgi:hypothetical protein